jgi:hypothetical protein
MVYVQAAQGCSVCCIAEVLCIETVREEEHNQLPCRQLENVPPKLGAGFDNRSEQRRPESSELQRFYGKSLMTHGPPRKADKCNTPPKRFDAQLVAAEVKDEPRYQVATLERLHAQNDAAR